MSQKNKTQTSNQKKRHKDQDGHTFDGIVWEQQQQRPYDFRGRMGSPRPDCRGWQEGSYENKTKQNTIIQLAQGGQVSIFLSFQSGLCACTSWTINILTFTPAHRPNSDIHTLSWGLWESAEKMLSRAASWSDLYF